MASLTNKELFRLGFLLKCAEEGLSLAQVRERASSLTAMAKQAVGPVAAAAGGAVASRWLPSLTGLIGTAAKYPLLLGGGIIGGGVLGGAGLGYAAAKATEEEANPELAKQHELIAAYRQQADRVRRAAAQRAITYRQPPRGRPV